MQARIEAGKLTVNDVGARKFVREVEHRTFSGEQALKRGQTVLYVTERCVFRLVPEGMELVEIAPGIDLARDILGQMDFEPIVRGTPRLMNSAIFSPGPMGLRERMLALPLAARFSFDEEKNLFFINFERLAIRSAADIAAVRDELGKRLTQIGHRVWGVVNYDHFDLAAELEDAWAAMVAELVRDYYWGVTRYTTSGFLRTKLGRALRRRGVSAHIYESAHEALEHVRSPDA
jgi:propionate CoA-transferase